MKKGLRQCITHDPRLGLNFNRRPDEEGIKTIEIARTKNSLDFNRRPDEEGIKTTNPVFVELLAYFNRRPDEEGIKTPLSSADQLQISISTADLMKKGLRPCCLNGIVQVREISTADLMKKGLRPTQVVGLSEVFDFNRRPDEEGIKTSNRGLTPMGAAISTADLMKKGLRRIFPEIHATLMAFQPQT